MAASFPVIFAVNPSPIYGLRHAWLLSLSLARRVAILLVNTATTLLVSTGALPLVGTVSIPLASTARYRQDYGASCLEVHTMTFRRLATVDAVATPQRSIGTPSRHETDARANHAHNQYRQMYQPPRSESLNFRNNK